MLLQGRFDKLTVLSDVVLSDVGLALAIYGDHWLRTEYIKSVEKQAYQVLSLFVVMCENIW